MATTKRRRYYAPQTRRIKIFPGIYINIGQNGASLSFGNKSAKATVGKTGTNYTVGIPGTGLSYRKKVSNKNKDGKPWISWLITAFVAVLGIFTNNKSKSAEKTSSTKANQRKTK
ncbi:MAG: DUF4236 domain-containing protein [Bacteroidales bacterium]|nr:DUF4236 domain-containing protein [Bacteroidales bacterium]